MATNDNPCPLRIMIYCVRRRHGRQMFAAELDRQLICVSHHPVLCAAAALLDQGHSPEMPVLFVDAVTGDEELTTLAKATESLLEGLGEVVELRRVQR